VDKIIEEANPDKAPGPDGFHARFFKKAWTMIGGDVFKAVKSLNLGLVNHAFITFIPKHAGADAVEDFRPISLCNFLYKVISKLLTVRLQGLIPKVISPNQFAFRKGRKITPSILRAHELCMPQPASRTWEQQRMCIKVDLRKAYNMVDRRFLLHVMKCMGFAPQWCSMLQYTFFLCPFK
jgi:hypothetical protein